MSLISVTDYFLGLEAGPTRAGDRRRSAIVARALARQRQRKPAVSRTRSAPATPGKPNWALESSRGQATKPRWLLSMPPEHVEVRRESSSPLTISLTPRVWDTLRSFARESCDGRETAGFLFADHLRSWHRSVSVRAVSCMVQDRAERWARLDIEALVGEKAGLRESGSADRVGEIGSWHTHPGSQDGRPSDADLAHWLNSCDFLKRPYLGLILTAERSDARWNNPIVHVWIVRRTGPLKRPVCEPALIERGPK